MTKRAFCEIPVIGPIFLTVGFFTFVYSTILGWSYCDDPDVGYLFGKKSIFHYRVLWVIVVMVGSLLSLPLIWDLADTMNMSVAILNPVALILLVGAMVVETKKYIFDGNMEDTAIE
jgi:alanine or glycine:cation symporter, AGCS family